MDNARSIWIIEDDPGLQFVYDEILGPQYSLRMFGTIEEFDAAISRDDAEIDLLIADLRLPKKSFLSYLRSDDGRKVAGRPMIIVSSMEEVDVLRFCYEKGAQDYLTKPFAKSELLVKVERAISGASQAQPPANAVCVDPVTLTVQLNGNKSEILTSKEFQIVSLVTQAPEYTLTRQELIDKIWGGGVSNVRTLDVHLVNLRKKLSPLGIEIRAFPGNRLRLLASWVDAPTGEL